MKRVLLIAMGAAVASVAFGQSLITSGSASFGWASPTDATISGAAVRTGTSGGTAITYNAPGGTNQMFQHWWWFRVNGVDTREFALSNLTSKSVVGNHMTLNYAEVEGASSFTANVDYTLTNQAAGTLVTGTAFLTNTTTSGAALDMAFFDYFDFDLSASASTNTATLLSDNPAIRMKILGTTHTAEFRGIDGAAYQVGAFSSIRTLLTDAATNNMNNTGLPFGPGDFSGANQWNFVLNPGEQIAVQTSFLLTPVPEPATFAVVGLGALALLRRRRKN